MMRIVLRCPGAAHAELRAELERVPPRERAERLRLLASVGLIVCRSGGLPGAPGGPIQTSSEITAPNPARFRGVRHRLQQSLDAGKEAERPDPSR